MAFCLPPYLPTYNTTLTNGLGQLIHVAYHQRRFRLSPILDDSAEEWLIPPTEYAHSQSGDIRPSCQVSPANSTFNEASSLQREFCDSSSPRTVHRVQT